jgi:hypothetical protein
LITLNIGEGFILQVGSEIMVDEGACDGFGGEAQVKGEEADRVGISRSVFKHLVSSLVV